MSCKLINLSVPLPYLVIIASFCWVFSACQIDESRQSFHAPSFASFQAVPVGVPSEQSFGAKLHEFTVLIDGCRLFPEDNRQITFSGQNSLQIVNLHRGNEGCRAHLESFVYGALADEDTFYPESAIVTTYSTGNLAYVNAQGEKRIWVAMEQNMSVALEQFEYINFYLMPATGNGQEVIYSEMHNLPDPENTQINIRLKSIKDSGFVGAEDYGIYVTFSCEDVRDFDFCLGQSLFSYQFKVLPFTTSNLNYNQLVALMSGNEQLIRPTITHLKDNGLAFNWLVPKNADNQLVPDILIVVKLATEYRYFVVDLSQMIVI